MTVNKKLHLILILIFLTFNCSKKLPEEIRDIISKFFALRNQEKYEEMYKLFYKHNDFNTFNFKETVYRKRFGGVEGYHISKWAKRQNFSCGEGSGKMLVVTVNVKYQYGKSIEYFTFITPRNNIWKIFDYYFKPVI